MSGQPRLSWRLLHDSYAFRHECLGFRSSGGAGDLVRTWAARRRKIPRSCGRLTRSSDGQYVYRARAVRGDLAYRHSRAALRACSSVCRTLTTALSTPRLVVPPASAHVGALDPHLTESRRLWHSALTWLGIMPVLIFFWPRRILPPGLHAFATDPANLRHGAAGAGRSRRGGLYPARRAGPSRR